MREWTHPDVYLRGIHEGWAEPYDDPADVPDWPQRQAKALVPFEVVDGRPVNPAAPTGIRRGRGELGHWGPKAAADAIVTVKVRRWWSFWLPVRHVLLIERGDGHGWAVPGGCVDPGETTRQTCVRELAEEAGLWLPLTDWRSLGARVMPDPRGTDESWMESEPFAVDLGVVRRLPEVCGADDAKRAAWVPARSYRWLRVWLRLRFRGRVFAAHRGLLAETL